MSQPKAVLHAPPSLRAASVYCLLMAACTVFGFLVGCDRDTQKGQNGSMIPSADDPNAPLPQLGQVPTFVLTSQNGSGFGSEQLAGRPYLAAFMFTRCPTICPRLTTTMKRVDTTVKAANLELRLLSISVDPEYDTPAALTEYGKKYGADPANWTFLTGDYRLISDIAEKGFKVGVAGKADPQKEHMGITHGSHLILVDKTGNIRGYFRSSDESVENDIVHALRKL